MEKFVGQTIHSKYLPSGRFLTFAECLLSRGKIRSINQAPFVLP